MDILTHIQKINLGDLVVLILAGVKLWDISKRFIAEITGQHDEKQEQEAYKEMVDAHEERLATMEKSLEVFERESRAYRILSLETKIFGYWQDATRQGYITQSQLKMFNTCLKKYFAMGGNSVVKEKYKPEVYALSVKD